MKAGLVTTWTGERRGFCFGIRKAQKSLLMVNVC
jgi:hypothetical protein